MATGVRSGFARRSRVLAEGPVCQAKPEGLALQTESAKQLRVCSDNNRGEAHRDCPTLMGRVNLQWAKRPLVDTSVLFRACLYA